VAVSGAKTFRKMKLDAAATDVLHDGLVLKKFVPEVF